MRAHAHRRPEARQPCSGLRPNLQALPADGTARHAPSFSCRSRQGNAIIRNTKGKKRRWSTSPRGSVKDKTSKWSRDRKGEEEKSQRERGSCWAPEMGPCALTDPSPPGKKQEFRMLLSPLRGRQGNYRQDPAGLRETASVTYSSVRSVFSGKVLPGLRGWDLPCWALSVILGSPAV